MSKPKSPGRVRVYGWLCFGAPPQSRVRPATKAEMRQFQANGVVIGLHGERYIWKEG